MSGIPAGKKLQEFLDEETSLPELYGQALDLIQEHLPLRKGPEGSSLVSVYSEEIKSRGFTLHYYTSYTYSGTDAREGFTSMLRSLIASRVRVLLTTTATSITVTEEGFSVRATSKTGTIVIRCNRVVVAVGRAGTEFLHSLDKCFSLGGESNHFEIGVRLEWPTSLWPSLDKYHKDFKVLFNRARTFCVCKDGYLVPYRCSGNLLVGGYLSLDNPTGLTNLAILVRNPALSGVRDHPTYVEAQARMSEVAQVVPLRQNLLQFIGKDQNAGDCGNPSTLNQWKAANILAHYPKESGEELRCAVEQFFEHLFPRRKDKGAVAVYAPAFEYFWPRFPLMQHLNSRVPGLYLVGDASGNFRGILQAFASGIYCAEHLTRL
ncbi:MAG: hypothetical protein NTZ09_08540 [Candidatus Hydrogenedentes bacterium]|nr:hypothetical protein [Candidatus Hydrogenedentota bacterium]